MNNVPYCDGDLRNWALQDGVLNTTDSANAVWQNGLSTSVGGNRVITFNAYDYLASNVDLINWLGADGIQHSDFIAAAQHYIAHGVNEGRAITFDAAAYFAANPDLAAYAAWLGVSNDEAAAIHYITAGRFEIAAGSAGRSAVGTPLLTGQNFTLTTGLDTLQGSLIGTAGTTSNAGDNIIFSNGDTLTAGDKLDGGTGYDTLLYSTNGSGVYKAAFELHNIEAIKVTTDNNGGVGFDFSGSDGIKVVESYNSTGSVTFDQLTALADVKVTNVTDHGDVKVHFQDSVVVGDTSVNLILGNNYNISPIGNIEIGSVNPSAHHSGIETLNVSVSGHAAEVTQLNSDFTTLNITGNQDLTIDVALNGTERTINAGASYGNITLASTNTGANAVTYIGSHLADTVTFAGTTGDHNISSGDGNDVITLGLGHDTVDLGANDDKLYVGTDGITVLDKIEGGAGHDEIIVTGADILTATEVLGITGVEVITFTKPGSLLQLSDNILTTSTGNFTFNFGVGGNTLDLTQVHTANTGKIVANGSTGSDLVIVNDATAAGFSSLAFGAGVDTLKIVDAATIDTGDLNNVTGLEIIELSSDKTQQAWKITIPSSWTGPVEVRVDPNVGWGSTLDITAGSNVKIYTTANVGVTVHGTASVTTSLFFTEQADTQLIGGTGDDLFVAQSLDQIQVGDNADGKSHVNGDRLLANFAVNDISKSIETFFSHATIHNIEILEFNPSNQTVKDVAFTANTTESVQNGDYDFSTFITSVGNDSILFQGATTASYTADLRDGNDTVYDSLAYSHPDGFVHVGGNNHINFIGGTNNDNFVFNQEAAWDTFDRYAAGDGYDTVTLHQDPNTGAAHIHAGDIANLVTDGALEAVHVDTIDDIVTGSANDHISVWVNDADLLAFTGQHADFQLDSAASVFFNASTVADGASSVNVNIYAPNAKGHILAVGGAGDDTFTIQSGHAAIGDNPTDAVDGGGIVGLRGADTIILQAGNQAEDAVVYKTAQDGGLEGQDGGAGVQDNIYNFEVGTDKIVFAYGFVGSYDTVADTGNGAIGTAMTKPFGYDLSNPSLIDMAHVELALWNTTGLTDANLLSLSTVAGYVSANTSLTNSHSGAVLVLAVESVHDTAFYWFTDENGNADVEANELSLMGVVHGAHLTTSDFVKA